MEHRSFFRSLSKKRCKWRNKNMKNRTFIFVGKSGSGKGTQAELLKKYFAEKMPHDKLLAVEMGAGFRDFFKHDRYTAALAKKITDRGGLQPVFLTVSIWGKFLIEEMTEGANIMIDGAPRRKLDAEAMDGAFEFYGREGIDVL